MIAMILALTAFFNASAAERLSRSKMHEYAQKWMSENNDIAAAKAHIPGLMFNHPSFLDHSQMQSYRYHELLMAKSLDGKNHEWEIIGGGIDLHFFPAFLKWSVGERIKLWKNTINFKSLISETEIGPRALRILGLKGTLEESDYALKRKILVIGVAATPIYWIEMKTHTSNNNIMKPRTIVINAINGHVFSNFSRHHHMEQNIPPTIVRNGIYHINKSKKETIDTSDAAIKEKYQDYCQVISTNKKAVGEPILINPEKCEIALKNEVALSSITGDASAKRASENSSKILHFYQSVFNQYGFDNEPSKATPITSIVHIGDHFDNAYWDSDLEVMAYGDGANTGAQGTTSDYTLALDIAGHEFTHAIVSHTANFTGPGEPGALNEAFADIFGILISRSYNQQASWNIGTALYNNADGDSDEVALRSLSNPKKFNTSTTIDGKAVDVPFPVKYSERLAAHDKECNDDNDQCEVHANSTIWSHNAYVIDQSFQSMGLSAKEADKLTGELFFLTLTHKLNENTTMKEAAREVVSTCKDILTSEQCKVVSSAFKESELIE